MNERNDGGPAFPSYKYYRNTSGELVAPGGPHGGMTLRDYFAAKAIVGFLPGGFVSSDRIQQVSRQAYEVADAMLKAREES